MEKPSASTLQKETTALQSLTLKQLKIVSLTAETSIDDTGFMQVNLNAHIILNVLLTEVCCNLDSVSLASE